MKSWIVAMLMKIIEQYFPLVQFSRCTKWFSILTLDKIGLNVYVIPAFK